MTAASPSVAALRAQFGEAIGRHAVSCGDTIVYVQRERAHDVLAWLATTPGQQFDYLTDVTAVEYRDPERPLEVVWQLRSLPREGRPAGQGRSSTSAGRSRSGRCAISGAAPTGSSARCTTCSASASPATPTCAASSCGRPTPRATRCGRTSRCAGHFSRAEQTRQALAANPEAHYSMEELSIAEAFNELPADMRERLARGERGFLK